MLTTTEKALFATKAPHELGDRAIHKKRGVIKCKYDFAVNAGATGNLLLKDEYGDAAILPINAIITQCYIQIITACTSAGGNGTIAVQANAANDLLSAVDADTLSGISAGVATGTAATMVKLTAQRQMTLVIGTEALTAGKFNFFVEFVLGD